jgi:hypothetical protein
MRVFFVTVAGACVPTPLLAQEGAQKPESKAPFMVSFADLKWVELPERKGMQFAVRTGNPKTGAYAQIRKVPAGTDNPLHPQQRNQKRNHQRSLVHGKGCGFSQRFRPRVGRDDAGRLDARKRLSVRKRLCVLPGGQREIRFQTFCGRSFRIG